ncbi:MAG: hypothetical protein GWM87_09660 [Xanthomonadales bacterium]|nr:hypothetical protein [Xanthomonadales bacterium]NIX13168.1 hypothetical protein [Xanthomonadales bacterium]
MPGAAPASRAVTQSSKLFPTLFDGQQESRRLSVFDAGPATAETVRFLGQFRSRLHIMDLYEEELVREQQSELEEQELKDAFRDILGFPVGTLIDVCLFWDFLNYLNRPALRAFGAALRPYLHPGTRGHGFSVLSVETPLRNQQYGIVQPDTLSIRPGRRAQLDYYPHSHEELNAAFDCFHIGRGWLLPDGRLEILLEARV